MNNTSDLAAALATRNAATLAWVAEDPSNRWACALTEDLAHWAEMGVTTAAELDHYLLVCDVFEGTREAWGYKPSWAGLMEASTEELQRMADSNSREIREQIEYEKREEQRERDEQRAHEQAFSDAMTPSGAWSIGDLVSL
ncbi:MAG: hypothetical protein ACO3Q6_08290 [Ilumatobacteraceae bacterium]